MSMLQLKDIGKIYVSDGNVSVGIRGVNLSFDKGEFVAVTGKSGSGKSTLLNVISGIDTYEEGELYIEGAETSHFLQPEWEDYREKYISFVFQDYNIIESFTVLQNVELALMHIEDPKERRKRALELIDKVGLSSHVKNKGTRLSGGQKQRTVIARALAKDSPIILADEPTGNLDSVTSKEIIELLREVSRDKLLIMVTHNFDEVESYATRHIRVFDGAVEFDHILSERENMSEGSVNTETFDTTKKKTVSRKIKNGFVLGKTLFCAMPKLSIFLCLLMLMGTLCIFAVTTLCGDAGTLFEPYYMFNHIDGRVVLAKQSGEVFTDDELSSLVAELGAKEYLHFDQLLDQGYYNSMCLPIGGEDRNQWQYPLAQSVYGKHYGDHIVGRYPEAKDEVFLYMPISYQPYLGKDSLELSEVVFGNTLYKLVGIKYFYDNNKDAECLFTDEGFRIATASHFLSGQSDVSIGISVYGDEIGSQNFHMYTLRPSFDIDADKIYVDNEDYQSLLNAVPFDDLDISVSYTAMYYKFNYYNGTSKHYTFEKIFEKSDITDKDPDADSISYMFRDLNSLIISDELLVEIAEAVLTNSYTQASIFFENDKEAHEKALLLQEKGYIAVTSDTTYEPDSFTVIENVFYGIIMALAWAIAIIFLAFFINLCSSRSLGAFKGDMAIMRSMGIPVKVIRIGMYVRMMIALIPAFIIVAIAAFLIFTSPQLNDYFIYLYGWQYALIVIGMIALTFRTTHKQIKKLFKDSVKKSLKGGASE